VNRLLPALVLTGALALGGCLVAAPAQAAPGDGTYYSVPGTSYLFVVDAVEGEPALGVATYEEWREDGFPAPRPAAVEYLKYTWDSTIYQDATVDGVSFSMRIDYATWRSVGFPTPRTDRLAADSAIVRYDGSDELFVQAGAAFTDDPAFHKLTFSEYTRLGYPDVDFDVPPLFRKLSWNPNIVGPVDQSETIGVTPFAVWDYFARPTPRIVPSFDGDRFCQARGSADIRYVGIAAPNGMKLSYGQWLMAGSPVPTRC